MFIRSVMTALGLVLGVTSAAEAGIIDRYAYSLMGNHRPAAPAVRILVVHDAKSALLRVDGKYAIVDPTHHQLLARRVNGKQRDVLATRHGIKWGEEFPDLRQLKLVPTSPETIIYVNGTPYSGIISVYDVDGKVSIVNEVDIEDYVASVLAAKMDQPVPKEALAAAAITQRTFAYYRSNFSKNRYWDIDGIHVRYEGISPSPYYGAAENAVDATSYMVMNAGEKGAKVQSDSNEEIGLFPAHWVIEPKPTDHQHTAEQRPTLFLSDAVTAAAKGQNAAQILNRVFPGVTVQRIYQVD